MALQDRLDAARREVADLERALDARREKKMPALRKLVAERQEVVRRVRAAIAQQGETPELVAKREQALARLLAARQAYDEGKERSKEIAHRIERLGKRVRKLAARKKAGGVISRASWGAAPPRGSYVRNAPIHTRVQHHTAGPTLSAGASQAAEEAEMRSIQRQHQGQGWTDIGYLRVVFPSGRVYEGRPEWAVGAHVLGHNTGTVGVSASGNYETAQPTAALIGGCRRAFGSLPGSAAPLKGHFQLNPTACPGRNLKPKLGEIA